MEIIIGRQVNGGIDIKVDEKYNLVSRQHAKLIYNDGAFIIEDLNTANGTYVNGKPVAVKKIKKEDIILLGSSSNNNAYALNVKKIADDIEQMLLDNKTDFSKEFLLLKNVYKSFKDEKEKINKQSQIKNLKPRLFFTLGIGLLLLIAYLCDLVPDAFGKLIYPLMMIVTLIPTVIGAFGKKADVSEALTDLQIQYGNKYCCPKCKKKLSLAKSWRLYEDEKLCPYKCGAEYKK